MQIVVIGMHRSGTSAVAELLVRMGAYFGPPALALPANEANPRGFWERLDVVSANEHLLASTGATWLTPLRFAADRVPATATARFDAEAAPIGAELAGHPVAVLKDPRLCLTLGHWRRHLPAPLCLFVHRNPLAVALSLRQRGDCSLSTGLALWEAYIRSALRLSRGLPALTLDYDVLMTDTDRALRDLHAALAERGAPLHPVSGAADGLDVSLRRQSASQEALEALARPETIRFHEDLRSHPPHALPDAPVSAAAVAALEYLAEVELPQRATVLRADHLQQTVRQLLLDNEVAQRVLSDLTSRPEVRQSLWLSRLWRRSGATAADLSAVEKRLGRSWNEATDALHHGKGTGPG